MLKVNVEDIERDFSSESKIEDCLSSSTQLERFLRYKARHHSYYKFYSSQEYIDSDLAKGVIYLNAGKNWNDVDDRENFQSVDSKKRYGLCLSYSKSENVAMWMLYGGMGKTGAMIDFKSSIIQKILQTTTIQIGKFTDAGFSSLKTLSNTEFTIDLIEVLYVAEEDDGYYTIRRSGKDCKDVNPSIVNSFTGIIKKYPWNYENECRLIVEIDTNILTQEEIDAADSLEISILDYTDEIKKRTYHAPNFNLDGTLTPKYNRSALKGSIDWDLCKNCYK